jgi:hypothetical protein
MPRNNTFSYTLLPSASMTTPRTQQLRFVPKVNGTGSNSGPWVVRQMVNVNAYTNAAFTVTWPSNGTNASSLDYHMLPEGFYNISFTFTGDATGLANHSISVDLAGNTTDVADSSWALTSPPNAAYLAYNKSYTTVYYSTTFGSHTYTFYMPAYNVSQVVYNFRVRMDGRDISTGTPFTAPSTWYAMQLNPNPPLPQDFGYLTQPDFNNYNAWQAYGRVSTTLTGQYENFTLNGTISQITLRCFCSTPQWATIQVYFQDATSTPISTSFSTVGVNSSIGPTSLTLGLIDANWGTRSWRDTVTVYPGYKASVVITDPLGGINLQCMPRYGVATPAVLFEITPLI